MKKILCVMLAMIMAFSACACGGGAAAGDRTVTDLVGREVAMADEIQNIAAMAGPTYEMTFMLDSVDKIKMVKAGHTTNYPLALLTNPGLADLNTLAANPSSSVNIEDYLAEEIDLVLYYETETELDKFENAGIPAIVISKNTGLLGSMEEVKAQTIEEYIGLMTSPIMILSDAINTEAAKAEAKATWEEAKMSPSGRQQLMQKERDELLVTTQEDIRSLADYIDAFVSENHLCVVGNTEKIKEEAGLFMHTENLF